MQSQAAARAFGAVCTPEFFLFKKVFFCPQSPLRNLVYPFNGRPPYFFFAGWAEALRAVLPWPVRRLTAAQRRPCDRKVQSIRPTPPFSDSTGLQSLIDVSPPQGPERRRRRSPQRPAAAVQAETQVALSLSLWKPLILTPFLTDHRGSNAVSSPSSMGCSIKWHPEGTRWSFPSDLHLRCAQVNVSKYPDSVCKSPLVFLGDIFLCLKSTGRASPEPGMAFLFSRTENHD